MNCVKSRTITEDSIKKSRFIAVISPCTDENEVCNQLQQLHIEHPSATHIVYAYRLKTDHGLVYRFHDAGEPSGTAGKPIYQHLEGKDLVNCLLAVIRYYGGIKLGTGGLTRAYSHSARRVIETAQLMDYTEQNTFALSIDYAQLTSLEYILKKLDGQILEKNFTEQVQVCFQLPKSNLKRFSELFCGKCSPPPLKKGD